MGRQTDDRMGTRERAPRTVELQPSRLAQRTTDRAHHFAGKGPTRMRSARMDSEHERYGAGESVSVSAARTSHAGTVGDVLHEQQIARAWENRARRQTGGDPR